MCTFCKGRVRVLSGMSGFPWILGPRRQPFQDVLSSFFKVSPQRRENVPISFRNFDLGEACGFLGDPFLHLLGPGRIFLSFSAPVFDSCFCSPPCSCAQVTKCQRECSHVHKCTCANAHRHTQTHTLAHSKSPLGVLL